MCNLIILTEKEKKYFLQDKATSIAAYIVVYMFVVTLVGSFMNVWCRRVHK